MAPTGPAMPALPPAPAQPNQLLGAPPAGKRKRTAGENAFDLLTYGGIALAANEVLSTAIVERTDKGRAFHNAFRPMAEASKKIPGLNKLSYISSGRAALILWATIGGTLLVAPVKWLEDHKGGIVNFFDNLLHGRDTSKDPELSAAHKEMEQAPKQSWLSLGQGRLVTMGSALALDSMVGWSQSAVTKLFDKPGKPHDFASFDRMSASFARWIVPKFAPQHKAGIQEVLATVKDPAHRYTINVAKEGKVTKTVATASMLMVLSSALTLLFYMSSKAFARGQEARRDRQSPAQDAPAVAADMAPAAPRPEPETQAQPATRVTKVENLSRLADATALQAGV